MPLRLALAVLMLSSLTGCAFNGLAIAPRDAAIVDDWGPATVIPAGLSYPQAVADSDGPYLLDTGDKLRIFVYGQPSLSRLYTVDHSGRITFPLIGAVPARGTTTYKLERAIAARLATQYVKDP